MFEYLAQNFANVENEIADACKKAKRERSSVRLIVVTKTYPAELAQAVIDLGQTDLGENRPQEMIEKTPQITGDFNMHLIGRLQSNKVRKVIGLAKYIHSVDSVKLLEKIDIIGEESGIATNILVQVNTSCEESKSGCAIDEAYKLCEAAAAKKYANFCGLMTIGPLTDSMGLVEKSFETLAKIGEKANALCENKKCELSMGMSGDFAAAIKYGATMIRIGTRLVGARNYNV
ncbi:MAG: YggS family pyridoxal phosphate-dependent enzyme [Chitinispirillales bacterium]|jgi:pyridoxal phosphate enzyme (YggS family)|nr:YggS family pyridoxal phosphate-dependent enzyme [Chitinispirillales bacterium]